MSYTSIHMLFFNIEILKIMFYCNGSFGLIRIIKRNNLVAT